MAWQFAPVLPTDIQSDPMQNEFFVETTEVEKLIREVIQNSLDAAAGNGPVRLRIQFSGSVNALPPQRAAPYLHGLDIHLSAVEPRMAEFLTLPMQYLTIEDYGTNGLRGDISDWKGNDPTNDFRWFWRNVGRSGKRGDAGGRWGVGKWVIPASSHIGAFFGLTARAQQPHRVLMGQAILKTHDIGGVPYHPYGFFCRPIQPGSPQLPFEGDSLVDTFVKDFRLLRGYEAHGLSLVIPYPNLEINATSIRLSVLTNYYWPLLRGDLRVEILHGSMRDYLTRDTALSFSAAHSHDDGGPEYEIARLIELASWLLDDGLANPKVVVPPSDGNPEWAKVDLLDDDVQYAREILGTGRPLSIRVETTVRQVDMSLFDAHFTVALRREDRPPGRVCEFVRGSISLPDAGTLKSGDIRGLVIIESGRLADLLGDAEEPAHRKWAERQPKVRENWSQGRERIRFVKQSAEWLATTLSRAPLERSEDLLQDVFFLEDDRGGETPPGAAVPRPDVPAGRPRPFRVNPIPGGFRVTSAGLGLARVTFAYDRREGKPFSSYELSDFTSADLDIRPDCCDVTDGHPNSFLMRTLDGGGRVEVTGFDEHRDVIVKVIEVSE